MFHEKPEQALFEIIKARFEHCKNENGPKIVKTFVIFQDEICKEEKDVEMALTMKMVELQQVVEDNDVEICQFWGSTLWNINDLEDFDAKIFTNWRKANDERGV